ncbi:hypothetical protein FA95DRAFT_1425905 [Auriscalpium vulgare]|uniref:Uncharacterized protein n=1 Tax=Auriscalpium vulgare TaxID=40419 RepID=A0ACB8RQX7_9AGAM|nr:hypothetical protein FA95DRAFT_1425905 [Auriscalpium vulgare]
MRSRSWPSMACSKLLVPGESAAKLIRQTPAGHGQDSLSYCSTMYIIQTVTVLVYSICRYFRCSEKCYAMIGGCTLSSHYWAIPPAL